MIIKPLLLPILAAAMQTGAPAANDAGIDLGGLRLGMRLAEVQSVVAANGVKIVRMPESFTGSTNPALVQYVIATPDNLPLGTVATCRGVVHFVSLPVEPSELPELLRRDTASHGPPARRSRTIDAPDGSSKTFTHHAWDDLSYTVVVDDEDGSVDEMLGLGHPCAS